MTSWTSSARISLHNATFSARSTEWFRLLLREVSDGSHLLVIGAGTCTGVLAHARAISVRQLTIVAQERDAAFASHARTAIASAGLSRRVRMLHGSLRDLEPPDGRLFDHVLCGGGFVCMTDGDADARARALARAVELLVDREDGRVFFAELLLARRSMFADWVAPAIAAAVGTGGLHVYEGDFDDVLCAAGLVIVRWDKLKWEGDVEGKEARLVVARSRKYVPGSVASAS